MGASENVIDSFSVNSYTFKKLQVEDLHQVKPLGKAFTESVNYPGGFNWDAFEKVWTPLLLTDIGRISVVTSGEEVVGVMGALFCADPFSGWMTALEQFWYVKPEHRKSRAGVLLFRDFEIEAHVRDCKKRIMVTLEGEFSGTLEEFYIRNGYHLVEKSFIKIV